jgi:hypothetical protein
VHAILPPPLEQSMLSGQTNSLIPPCKKYQDSLILPCTLPPTKMVTASAIHSNNQCFQWQNKSPLPVLPPANAFTDYAPAGTINAFPTKQIHCFHSTKTITIHSAKQIYCYRKKSRPLQLNPTSNPPRNQRAFRFEIGYNTSLSRERECKLFFRQDIMSCNGHEDRWKSARFLFASINKLAKLFVSFLMHPCFQGCQSLISIRPDNKLLGRGGVTLFLVFSAF